MKCVQLLIGLSIIAFAAVSFADTVIVKDGDKLVGQFQTPYIGIEAPYQNLIFNRAFISEIIKESGETDQYSVITINNDIFRGKLINAKVETELTTGETIVIPNPAVRDVGLDDPGKTEKHETTVFFVDNGDRFSGKLLTPSLAIETGQLSLSVNPRNIARITFTRPGTTAAEILMIDGSRLIGEIQETVLRVAPDSIAPVNICTINFSSIQFNALKYLKRKADSAVDGAFFPEVSADITGGGANCMYPTPRAAIDAAFEALRHTTILYDTDKAVIKPEYNERLDRIADFLRQNHGVVVHISGHTDIRASATYNMALSERRAAAVRQYMEKAGVAPEQIRKTAFGLTKPVADNQTVAGKRKNRRAELVLSR